MNRIFPHRSLIPQLAKNSIISPTVFLFRNRRLRFSSSRLSPSSPGPVVLDDNFFSSPTLTNSNITMAANQRLQKGDGPKLTTGKLIAQPSSFKTGPKAPFLDRRLQVWDRLYQKHQENLAKEDKKPIQIELPDGNKKAGVSFETTPLSIAEGISKKLAEQVMVAKVGHILRGEDSCTIFG